MHIKYEQGPAIVGLEDGQVAKRGESVEVSDELGKRLLAQGFEEAKKSTPKKSDKKED